MKHLTATVTLLIGLAAGLALPRWGVAPVLAQEHTHTTAPAATAMPMPMTTEAPMPMASGMMHCPDMMQMHGGMMHGEMMHSAADRGYMGAMMQMHGGMMRATMTGNADHDFLAMMIPHHQAAVAMAQTELQYGHDAKVRALAKRIIAAQEAEIRQMQSWLH